MGTDARIRRRQAMADKEVDMRRRETTAKTLNFTFKTMMSTGADDRLSSDWQSGCGPLW
jgi:hypothetical protein